MNFAGRKVYIGKDVAEEVITRAELADSVEALSRRELSEAARRRKAGASMRTHKLKRLGPRPRPTPAAVPATVPEMAASPGDGAVSDSDSDDEGAVRERISTNVVAVDLESVRDAAPFGGDAGTVVLRCPNPRCGALFSSLSELTGTTWVCEFCACSVGVPADVDPASVAGAKVVANDADTDGDASPGPDLDDAPSEEPELDRSAAASGAGGDGVVLDPIEVAGETSVAEFVLCDPASEAAAAAATGDADAGVSTTGIVFVCDISGSMRATSKAPRGYKREDAAEAERLAEESARETLTAAGLSAEEITQQLAAMRSAIASASRSGGVYISRLEGLQQAIRSQVGDLAKEVPTRPIALVTFCDDVGVHVVAGQTTLTGATLRDDKALLEAGASLWATHAKPVASCSEDMASIVKRFEPEGGTALGPGTMVGIGIASKMGSGSRVMVVTDGVANTGVGCLSASDPDFDDLAEANRGSDFYHKAGTIAAELGVVVDVVAISGDGAALEHLGNLAAAANGEIRTVDPASLATEFDEIVAAEVFATQAEVATVPLPEGMTSVPFQMQVWFKRPGDDRRFLRVITQDCPVTAELEEATSATNVVAPVMAAYAKQRAAQLAAHGQYRQCRAATHAYGRVLAQNAVMLASEADVDRLVTPAPARKSSRGGRASSERKAKAGLLSRFRARAASVESSDDDEAGMAARLERIGSGDGSGESGDAGGGLAMYGSWLSGMAGLDNAIRAEMASEAADGLALEELVMDDVPQSAMPQAAMAVSPAGAFDALNAAESLVVPSRPFGAGGIVPTHARGASLGIASLASGAPTSGWAGVSDSASRVERAQHAMRSGRRAGNDALSSAIQSSMRRGKTSRAYAKKRGGPTPAAAEDE